jgi:hypothetical protein
MVTHHAQDYHGAMWTRQDNKPTVIFEDNVACVTQVGTGFIKSDRVKHICP